MKDANFDELMGRIILATGAKNEASISAMLGITHQSIYNAKNKGKLPTSWVYELSKKNGISADWLFFGTGPMLRGKTTEGFVKAHECGNDDVDIIMIPMAEARLSAGCGSLEVDAKSERKYGFRSDFLFRKGSPKNMILMRVSGDSMAPEIEDNDVVLLDQSKKEITPGRLYAVGFEDAIYLKRIDKLPGKVVLKSTNPAYPPVELNINGDCEDLFRVIGRVLWCGREYK